MVGYANRAGSIKSDGLVVLEMIPGAVLVLVVLLLANRWESKVLKVSGDVPESRMVGVGVEDEDEEAGWGWLICKFEKF